MVDLVWTQLQKLSHEIRELDVGHEVHKIHAGDLSPLTFHRDYVSRNKPVIITGALEGWPAVDRWNRANLELAMGLSQVSMAVTPDGRADAVKQMPDDGQQVFALPATERRPFSDFLEAVITPEPGEIVYAQSQNNSMAEEFPQLMLDISELEWATEAFGAPPEATNLWIGGDESITSFHKDHYENIYAVICGVKVFFLLPPADAYRLGITPYPMAQYARDQLGRLKLSLVDPKQEVPWSPVNSATGAGASHLDPWNDGLPSPLIAEVGPGEVLYLPSLWFHSVAQKSADPGEPVIAVNFWYDMAFDCKAAYAKFCEELAAIALPASQNCQPPHLQ